MKLRMGAFWAFSCTPKTSIASPRLYTSRNLSFHVTEGVLAKEHKNVVVKKQPQVFWWWLPAIFHFQTFHLTFSVNSNVHPHRFCIEKWVGRPFGGGKCNWMWTGNNYLSWILNWKDPLDCELRKPRLQPKLKKSAIVEEVFLWKSFLWKVNTDTGNAVFGREEKELTFISRELELNVELDLHICSWGGWCQLRRVPTGVLMFKLWNVLMYSCLNCGN